MKLIQSCRSYCRSFHFCSHLHLATDVNEAATTVTLWPGHTWRSTAVFVPVFQFSVRLVRQRPKTWCVTNPSGFLGRYLLRADDWCFVHISVSMIGMLIILHTSNVKEPTITVADDAIPASFHTIYIYIHLYSPKNGREEK